MGGSHVKSALLLAAFLVPLVNQQDDSLLELFALNLFDHSFHLLLGLLHSKDDLLLSFVFTLDWLDIDL